MAFQPSAADALSTLVHELSKLPGIGEKSATRLAFHLLGQFRPEFRNHRRHLRFTHEPVSQRLCRPFRAARIRGGIGRRGRLAQHQEFNELSLFRKYVLVSVKHQQQFCQYLVVQLLHLRCDPYQHSSLKFIADKNTDKNCCLDGVPFLHWYTFLDSLGQLARICLTNTLRHC